MINDLSLPLHAAPGRPSPMASIFDTPISAPDAMVLPYEYGENDAIDDDHDLDHDGDGGISILLCRHAPM